MKVKFPFSIVDSSLGNASFMPYLPFQLSFQGKSVEVSGLLDTGASVNVLPYSIGLALGADWENLTVPLQLSGNLAHLPAKAILIYLH